MLELRQELHFLKQVNNDLNCQLSDIMEFRLEHKPPVLEPKIKLTDHVMLMGSCFTEHMFERFNHYKFNAIQNLHGTLFNPRSIYDSINQYIEKVTIKPEEMFLQNSLWNHWSFHSSYSHHDKETAMKQMEISISGGHQFLKSADWLIITFGSAFVYELGKRVVANCHKVPSSQFNKMMMWPDEIFDLFNDLIFDLKAFNQKLNILFTVSPVRHLKDGFVENNRSKSSLLLSIEKIITKHAHCFYFPSYELLIDDLRDYRFYAEDMVHPNYLATRYVWDKFSITAIDGKSREIFKEIDQLQAAMLHKVMHPGSEEHLKFIQKYKIISEGLNARFPELNWQKELEYFKSI